MKWAQSIIQLKIKKIPFICCFFSVLFVHFLLPGIIVAQNKYKLAINVIDKDTVFSLSHSALKLQPLALQTSFTDVTSCSDYVYHLPGALAIKGYAAASVDSLLFDSVGAHIYLFLGPQYKLEEINTDSVEKKALGHSTWNKQKSTDKRFNFNDLQIAQQEILRYYENTGYPFASIKLNNIQIKQNNLKASVHVTKGILYHIDSITVYGKVNIKKSFLQQYLGIINGSTYDYEKLQNVSKRLAELPYLREQHPFDVVMLGSGATLNLYLEPKRSSQINFLVGFLPGDNITGKSQVTGDINLDLKNSLAAGETILLNWQQLQRKSPRLNLGYQHPYIFNSPFGIDFTFDLLKRDSGFLQLHTQLGLLYALSVNKAAKLFIQNQRAYLLQGGYDTNQIRILKMLPPNIDVRSNSIGIDYEWRNTNYRFNPRKGNELRFITTIGLKKISKNNDIVNLKDPANPGFNFNALYDSLQLKTYQLRFIVKAAHYFAAAKSSTLKMGISAGIFQSQNIFRNELFQIGGYKLLRGFNEESIYATHYAVLTAEYRYLAGLNSYLFGFTDVGFTRTRFQLNNFTNNYLGVGLGLTFETRYGLLNVSYAMGKRNDVKFDVVNSSKIHFGYINYF